MIVSACRPTVNSLSGSAIEIALSHCLLILTVGIKKKIHNTHSFSLCISMIYSNFRSYKSAAINTTRQEPQLCTNAPVVGVSNPKSDNAIATKLMQSDKEILNLIVFIVATKIISLNQFILWTIPIEIVCFIPAILHLFV